MKKLGLWFSILLATLMSACSFMQTESLSEAGTNSESFSSSETLSEPTIVEETIFDFEGSNPLKGGAWYTQKYANTQQMEEIVAIDGNAMLKITPKLNSWAGVIANPFIGLGSAVTQFKITIASGKAIDSLPFEIEYDLYKWTSVNIDVQEGTHEYLLEYEQPIQFLFGFSIKANPSLYSELYLDNFRCIKVID